MKKIFFALLFSVCAISTIFSTQSAFAKDDSCDGLKFDTLSVAGTCLNVENIEDIGGAEEGEVCWCHIESISPKPGGYSEWFGYSTLEGCGEFCDAWCADQISNEDIAYQDWLETLSECEEPEPEPKCISVEFNSNGMSGGLENQYYYKWDTGPDVSNIYVDSACEEEVDGVSAPTSSGNIFTGYFNNSTNGSGTQYINSSMGTTSAWNNITTSGTTLYAQYTGAPCVTITLDANGGDLNPWNNLASKKLYKKGTLWYSDTKDKCKKDENLITTLSPIPGKSGAFFDGLYENSDGTGEQYIDENGNLSNTWFPTSDTAIYAKYAGCILITLDDNCGANPGTAQVWKIDGRPGWYSNSTCTTAKTTQSAPTCAIAGTFGGYYTTRASSGGTRYITSASTNNLNSNWAPTSSTTLYARWTSCAAGYHTNNTGGCDVNTYTIHYNPGTTPDGCGWNWSSSGSRNLNQDLTVTYGSQTNTIDLSSAHTCQRTITGWHVSGITGNQARYNLRAGGWTNFDVNNPIIDFSSGGNNNYIQFENLTTTNNGTITITPIWSGSCSLGSETSTNDSTLLDYVTPTGTNGMGVYSMGTDDFRKEWYVNVVRNNTQVTIYGDSMSLTSAPSNVNACATGTPTGTLGNGYCWCRVLGYENSSHTTYTPVNDLPWVYVGTAGANGCATKCTVMISTVPPNENTAVEGCSGVNYGAVRTLLYTKKACSQYRYKIQYNLGTGGKIGTYAPGYGIYGENIRVSPPTKYGYTFTGWTIQNSSGDPRYGCNPSYDINTQIGNSTVNCSGDIYFKNLRNDNYDPNEQNAPVVTLLANWSGNNACPIGQSVSQNSIIPSDAYEQNNGLLLNTNNSSVTGLYGTVVLESKLSVTSGTTGVSGNPLNAVDNEAEDYCWCRVVSYTPTGLQTIQTPNAPWVYYGDNYKFNPTNCHTACLETVAYGNSGTNTFRQDLYSSAKECMPLSYTISYTLNGGVASIAPTTVYYDKYFSVSTPVKQGYRFVGWNISDMDSTTHYYGTNSGSVTTPFTAPTCTTSNNVTTCTPAATATYFKNLRSTSGTVTFTAVWEEIGTSLANECDIGYRPERSGLPQGGGDTGLGTDDYKLGMPTNTSTINSNGSNFIGTFSGYTSDCLIAGVNTCTYDNNSNNNYTQANLNNNAYGTVYGTGICSTIGREPNPIISGSIIYQQYQYDDISTNSGGQYCWCHLNTYMPTSGSTRDLVHAPYVFLGDLGSSCSNSSCASFCSEQSMDYSIDDRTMRTTLYQDTYYCAENTYTIQFVLNNGSTLPSQTPGYTQTVSIQEPSVQGATFDGWTITGTDSNAKYSGDGGTNWADLSNWQSNTYVTATYFKNLTATNGATVTFTAHWSCSSGYHWDSSNGVCAPNCNTITFNDTTNGGVSQGTILYKKTNDTAWYTNNQCTTQLSPANVTAPTKANATFAGYYTDPTNTTIQVGTAASPSVLTTWTVTASETLYAHYNCNANYQNAGTNISGVCQPDPHTIALNQNGGVAPSGQTLTSTLYTTYNTNVYIDSARTNAMTTASNSCSNPVTPPTKTGYTFAGYYSASSGGTQYIDSNGCITTNGLNQGKSETDNNDVWYAQYTPNCNMITFNNTANGGSANTYRYRKTDVTNKWYSDSNCTNETTTIGAPTKANATFAGYYVEQNTRTTQVGTTASPILPSSWATTTTATVYAHYSCSANYRQSGEYISGACTTWEQTITLNKNNGSGGTSALYTRYGVGVYINSARNPGHMMSEDDSQNQGGGITIGEGLNAPNPITPPEKFGYTFAGYYSASQSNNNQTNGTQYIDANGYITSDGISAGTALQADGTWYAQYIPQCNEIVIDNETNGGSTQNGTLYKKTGDAAWYSDSNCTTATTTVTKPEKDHATFLAYYVSDDVNAPGNTVSNGVPTFNTGASAFIVTSSMLEELEPGNYITVYAHYSCDEGYQHKGINIQNACEPDQRTITLDDEANGGDAGSGAIYTIYDTGVYTDSSRQDQMTTSDNPVTIPTKGDAVFTGYYDSDSGTKKYIDEKGYITDSSSGDDGISAGIAYTSDETWYAQFEDCACTFGAHVASCVLSGVEDNQCVFEYTCDSGYNTDGAHNAYTSNSFTGDTGVGANTSPDCYENVIALNWYRKVDYDDVNNNSVTQLSVPQASQSCTYGDAITIPDSTTVPALYIKGKHLTGWTVVQ